jgi:hypothetical protein
MHEAHRENEKGSNMRTVALIRFNTVRQYLTPMSNVFPAVKANLSYALGAKPLPRRLIPGIFGFKPRQALDLRDQKVLERVNTKRGSAVPLPP